ncbi:NupC/NupG family nucleoside CNT transporter [Janibacter sp. CX7]|uniref:NupC/NupG family nucleoside CNT transporter n=1 Tax=Janibacter sp. CX7 TaxID=2963431 RepID=UPI0020CE58B5|nr:NupC/NupG family nucleoside CNT transporter [Janibacter sp. CX7]UTT67495.1 NupC/NupG family nucleoside CNT transporter [Janibacter sp. CX7]
MHVIWGLAGMLGLLVIAAALSTNRRAIRLRTVLPALAIQVGFGALVLFVPWGRTALRWVSDGFQSVIDSATEGISFLFGPLLPDEGVVFALQVLPVVVFFASLTGVLFHLGWLQVVVRVLGGGLQRVLGTGRAESTNAAANIFLGQTEAPLVIRPYVAGLTRSGLFAVMVGGLATVAGSVLVGYSLLGAELDYLIAASFMAAPGALLMAKMLVPEEPDNVAAGIEFDEDEVDAAKDTPSELGDVTEHRNVIDAAAAGAADGAKLAINIGAMLLAFISLIALLNAMIGGVGGWFGHPGLSFETIIGYVFAPIMLMIGVPWHEAVDAGSFLGQKVIVNEFVAFTNFGPEVESYSPRTQAIVTFALTGFANLSSLGILLGGLGSMAPSRRKDIASLGMRAILAATLANLMSATIAGIMLG